MTRHIIPHKGGRTSRIPAGRIRPQTVDAIHAEMQERGKSFADLVEERWQGENTMNTQAANVYVDGNRVVVISVDANGNGIRGWQYDEAQSHDVAMRRARSIVNKTLDLMGPELAVSIPETYQPIRNLIGSLTIRYQ